MSLSSIDSSGLDRSIGDLAAALGDPTRRGIYLAVRQSAEPVTSGRIAELFAIHPNVARHHLDKLAEEGYVRITHQRRNGRTGPGAGRPAKCYEATSKSISIHPGRRYDLLVELLVRVLDDVKPEGIAAVAEKVGREYGRELAESLGTPDDPGYEGAVQALAKVMGGVGFEVSADLEGPSAWSPAIVRLVKPQPAIPRSFARSTGAWWPGSWECCARIACPWSIPTRCSTRTASPRSR